MPRYMPIACLCILMFGASVLVESHVKCESAQAIHRMDSPMALGSAVPGAVGDSPATLLVEHLTGDSVGAPIRGTHDDVRTRNSDNSLMLRTDAVESPGIAIGSTAWDQQYEHSQGYQVAKISGGDLVHFTWTRGTRLSPGPNDNTLCAGYAFFVLSWNYLNDPGWIGSCGWMGWSVQPSGRANLALDHDSTVHMVYDHRPDTSLPFRVVDRHYYWAWGFSQNYSATILSPEPITTEAVAPRIEVQQNDDANGQSGVDVLHIIAHSSRDALEQGLLIYWRFDGLLWAGPVVIDSSATHGHVLASDANSQKVAVLLHTEHAWDGQSGLRNIAIYESETEGLGWIDGTELGPAYKELITAYGDSLGPEAWVHIASAYDHNGVLHAIWDERRWYGIGTQIVIRHWSSERGTIQPVAYGYWDNPVSNGGVDLNLAKMTIGVGDGSTPCSGAPSNENYLYVLYTQFGGLTEEEKSDYSAAGYMNGELYLTVSSDGGDYWSVPVNLTNTKTPGCYPDDPDSVCASDHWGSIARTVDDIHIAYVGDRDAGAVPLGEGTWTSNLVLYLRLPGGEVDAEYLCPDSIVSCACFCHGDPKCDGQDNVFDVVTTVDVAFREGSPRPDPHDLCPYTVTDVDCDGDTDVLDVVRFVAVAFRNEPPEDNFCDPCSP